MRRRAVLLTLAALVAPALAGGDSEALLFEARHAHLVLGQPERAEKLYREALADTSLDAARQAEIHLRVALCLEEQNRLKEALNHLLEHVFAGDEVRPEVREAARRARGRIEARLPREVSPAPPPPTAAESAAHRLAEDLASARRFLESGDELRALWHAQRALRVDPDNAEARRIDAEVEARLSGVTEFIRDPLRFVREWTETRITQVAQQAQEHLARAVEHADDKEYNLAWSSFRQAVAAIDACEFGRDAERLVELRQRTVAHWDAAHRKAYGKPLEERAIEAPPARSTVLGEYLNRLQGMLDLVSSKEREYRIVPVQSAPGRTDLGWSAKPADYRLFRDQPSTWSPALFARLYLPQRVQPEAWAQRGNYLEAVGGMLVARNRSVVLDLLLDEVRRMERPAAPRLEARFLLVPVPRTAVARFEEDFGAFTVSHRGPTPVQFRVVSSQFGLVHLCAYLRDDAEVRPDQDTFAVTLVNGAPQTFFVARPLASAPDYDVFEVPGGSLLDAHFGVLLDLYPLQDRDGRTATGMRLSTRLPVAPLEPRTPRFLTQEGELFVDLPPGSTLVVAGLLDPFAGGERELLLLWHNPAPADAAAEPPAPASPLGAEVPLRNLLLKQRDFPGPRFDEERGFVPRDRLEVLADRATFLERLLREELEAEDGAIGVHAEEAVARVPPALREDAVELVAAMERESGSSYVIEAHTRAVRSSVLMRWLEREGLALQRMEGAAYALADTPDGAFLLRTLDPTEPPDVFAPRGEWHKPTALGLQARHLLSTRTRTSPVYDSEDDLASGETRTITEGLRIGVRPYTWRGQLLVEVEVETAALEADLEERALPLAVPSHRTRFAGTRARGTVDLGEPGAPKTLLLCRLPHPSSRPERVTEIVVTLSVRKSP